MKYLALLRGINVSGQKLIKMADLRALLTSAGLAEVQTYIQSGNVIFEHPAATTTSLEKKIASAIKDHYDFEVSVMVLKSGDWEYIFQHNPFLKKGVEDIKTLHVTILAQPPQLKLQKALDATTFAPDDFILDGRFIYICTPNGYGRTKITNHFFESKLKTSATTRNWKTVLKLWELLNEN